MEEILKIRYFKEDYQKAIKKLTLLFSLKPSPFNGGDYEKGDWN